VLKPLVLKDRKKLPESVRQWNAEIKSLGLPHEKTKNLDELLEYAVLQRFSDLNLEEVRKMIQLTPLEETVAVQELLQLTVMKGKEEWKREGKKEGKTETALNLLKMGLLTDEQIVKATSLAPAEVKKLKQKLGIRKSRKKCSI